MATTEQTSTRYNHLVKVIDKALLESRKGFDTEEAIKECYGDDASMFHDGSSHEADNNSVNVLASAIDAMVDRVNEKVKKEMLEFLERERVPERLAKVEAIINQLCGSGAETGREQRPPISPRCSRLGETSKRYPSRRHNEVPCLQTDGTRARCLD